MLKTTCLALFASAASAACDTGKYTSCVAAIVPDLSDFCKLVQESVTCLTDAGCVDKDYCDALQASADAIPDCKITCNAGCFPASAEVLFEGGMTKKMADLAIGDKVHVGNGKFSEIYYFSHELEDTSSKFLQLATADNTLMLTPGHFLYVNGVLAEARTAVVGDKVTLADGSTAPIEKITSSWAPGLYNPHTMHGDIVVDGVLTSTYTDAVHPTLAHALLAPLRQLYSAGLVTFGKPFGDFTKGLPSWILDAIKA